MAPGGGKNEREEVLPLRVLNALQAGAVSAAAVAAMAVVPGPALAAGPAAACQPYAGKPCLFPFPDNRLTRPDRTSATGAARQSAGVGHAGQQEGRRGSKPGPYDRDDGFSPGSAIVLHIAGLDNAAALKRTGAVPVTDIAQVAGQASADRASSTRPPARAS